MACTTRHDSREARSGDALCTSPRRSRKYPPRCPGGRLDQTYFAAEDRNATSAWIWLGLSVFENVSGMIPAL